MEGRTLNGCIGNNHCFLSKSNQNGGVQFSHDPLNLVGKNSRKVNTIGPDLKFMLTSPSTPVSSTPR